MGTELLFRVDRPGEGFRPIRPCSRLRRLPPPCLHQVVSHPAKEKGIGPIEVLGRVTVQVFVREYCTMIAPRLEPIWPFVSQPDHGGPIFPIEKNCCFVAQSFKVKNTTSIQSVAVYVSQQAAYNISPMQARILSVNGNGVPSVPISASTAKFSSAKVLGADGHWVWAAFPTPINVTQGTFALELRGTVDPSLDLPTKVPHVFTAKAGSNPYPDGNLFRLNSVQTRIWCPFPRGLGCRIGTPAEPSWWLTTFSNHSRLLSIEFSYVRGQLRDQSDRVNGRRRATARSSPTTATALASDTAALTTAILSCPTRGCGRREWDGTRGMAPGARRFNDANECR